MRPYPQMMRDEAVRLRAEGHIYREISDALGVTGATVQRWLKPAFAERQRIKSRDAKRRHVGVCEVCGGVTHYNGHGIRVSTVCGACHYARQRAAKHWTRQRVIAAIQRWASEHDGKPPTSTDWIRSGADGSHPSMSSVYRGAAQPNAPFATWAEAIEAAGYPRPRSGGFYERTPEHRADFAARIIAARQRNTTIQ